MSVDKASLTTARMSAMQALLPVFALISGLQLASAFSLHHGTLSLCQAKTSHSSLNLYSLPPPFQSTISMQEDASAALSELLNAWNAPQPKQQAMAFLFVGQKHANSFQSIVAEASRKLGPQTKLLALISGGVVGASKEVDDASVPSMSLWGGILPDNSQIDLFGVSNNDDIFDDNLVLESSPDKKSWLSSDSRPPSYVLFADPFSTRISKVLKVLDGQKGVVAGGISVPETMVQPSVAIQDKVLPPGSLVGARLMGNVGLQVIVAQGCRPLGRTFTVTSVQANAVAELDYKPAIQQLEKAVEEASKEDQELVRNFGVLGGIHRDDSPEDHTEVQDFLIRQVFGFRPQSGSILVGGHIHEGDSFRFHVRSAESALEDLALMIQRAKTERLFLGPQNTGKTLAALQISCVARGKHLFKHPNVDLHHVESLFEDQLDSDAVNDATKSSIPPIGGFFANGEIGPVGICMGADRENKSKSHLLGFTTVIALLCDFTSRNEELHEEAAALGAGVSTIEGAWG